MEVACHCTQVLPFALASASPQDLSAEPKVECHRRLTKPLNAQLARVRVRGGAMLGRRGGWAALMRSDMRFPLKTLGQVQQCFEKQDPASPRIRQDMIFAVFRLVAEPRHARRHISLGYSKVWFLALRNPARRSWMVQLCQSAVAGLRKL